MTEAEVKKINDSKKEVRKFFIFIQQLLVLQTIQLIVQTITMSNPDVLWLDRIFDIVDITNVLSYMLMYVGIIASIKRAYNAFVE